MNRQHIRGPLFSRRIAISTIAVASLTLSSSAIAADYETEQQSEQQQWRERDSQQQRYQQQGQQERPSQSREQGQQRLWAEGQQDQVMSYDYEDGQFQTFQREERTRRFGARPQRDRDFFEKETEFREERWSPTYEQEEEFTQQYEQRRYGQPLWQQTARKQRISGCIDDLRTMRLWGVSQPHVFAEITTDDGRELAVDLGPQNRVAQLDIEEGDRITVTGVRSRMDERPIILATQLQAHGETVRVDRPVQSDFRRYQGEIVDTQIGFLRSHGHRHLLARVRLDDGRLLTVDLGPQQELRQVSLRSGNEIQLQARPSRILGERALIARQFRTDGQSFEVEDLERRQQRLRGQPIGDEFEQQQWEEQQYPRGRQQEEGMSQARPSGRLIEISTRGYEFQPSQISVLPGQRVRIRLINRGASPHSIAFELPQGDVRMETPLAAGEVGTLVLTAPQQPGTYTFYCPIAEHRGLGMEGRLVVQSQAQQQSQQQESQQPQY